ncbi:hypothetical protein [Acinetobacter sp. HY1485]|uniref:hypothetical protein n=1 Tax=Acinetobacter sp. HY1485 TaxID=2970918 RepID=UPI0022B9770B|nr:hypothetical protein [Acinetobacter sp. HY1485]
MKILIVIVLIVFIGISIWFLIQSKKLLNATVKAESELPKQPKPRQLHPQIAKNKK